MGASLRDLLFGKHRNNLADELTTSHTGKVSRVENAEHPEPKKQEITLPHKVLPETLGRVFQFSVAESRWSLPIEDFNQYLALAAHDLMYTDIAVEEGGYLTPPSVLVIEPDDRYNESPSSVTQTLQAQRGSFTNKTFRPYGTRKSANLFNFTESNSRGFSEASMLGDIRVSTDTGIHTLPIKLKVSKQEWITTIASARKFFDIVLINPLSPTLSYGDLITNINVGYKKSEGYLNNSELQGEDIAYCQTAENFIEAKMFADAKTYLTSPEHASFSVMRALTHDFIRYLLGVDNPIQSTDDVQVSPFTKKVNKWAKRVVGHVTDAEGIDAEATVMLAVIYGFMAWVIAAVLHAVGLQRFAFVLAVIPAIAAVFVAVFIGAAMVRGVMKLRQRRTLKKVKASLAQLSPAYSYAPLANSAMMRSINKKRYFTELVERVDLGTVIAESELLPLDSLSIRIDELKERWMEYELDPIKVLEYPMLLDASIPSTSAFLTAYQELESYERQFQDDQTKAGLLAKSLSKAEEAFIVAENAAKKSRLSHLTSDQKKRIKNAKPLVAIAASESASPTERMGAWKRANDILEGVLALPEASVMGLLETAK